MGLFNRKNQQARATYFGEPIIPEDPVNYDQVLEYLVGLSAEDYTAICQVAAIYRQADFEAAKVHGRKLEPTTFITPPQPTVADSSFTDDDGNLNFLEDDHETAASRRQRKAAEAAAKSKKIDVKD